MNRQGTLLILVALALTLTAFSPTAQAVPSPNGNETFEDDTVGTNPNGKSPGETNPFYAFTWIGGAAQGSIDTSQKIGTKSFYADQSAVLPNFLFNAGDICSTAGYSVSFSWRLDALPSAGQQTNIGLFNSAETTAGNTAQQVSFQVSSTGVVSIHTRSSTASGDSSIFPLGAFTVIADKWYNATLTTSGCSVAGTHTATLNIGVVGNEYGAVATWSGVSTLALNSLKIGNSAGQHPPVWFDNIAITNAATVPVAGSRFCANPSEANFGYDYVEDVIFNSDVQDVGVSLEDAFFFFGSSGNSDYLGKGFATGTTAVATRANIEALSESTSSVFRIGYTTGATTLTAGAAGDGGADMTAAGNGHTTGNWANSIKVVFTEHSDHWEIEIMQTVAGTETRIGSAVNYNVSPNTPTVFNFTADSVSTLVKLTDSAGTIIISRNLPAGLQNVVWKDQWFVGLSTSIADAGTFLDDTDQGQDDDSTCIFDLTGTLVITGSSGLSPGSTVPNPSSSTSTSCDSFLCVDSTNVPEGFTASTFNFFLGLILCLCIGAGLWFLTHSPAMAGVGFGVGYLIALAFGLVPLWPIVALVVIAAGIVFVRLKSGA